jgi:SSS family solute:Na+ symporter
MHLHNIDVAIIVSYLCLSVFVGYWVSSRASRDIRSYFLGGNTMPWYVLGVSDASGMFDIGGTMWLVYIMFVYGLKSVWIPWLWPVFNQVFLMVYLSAWLRRSGAMTGAEWIETRFGKGRGAQLSHLIVVIFALVSVVAFLSYAFKAIGKFATDFLPWHLSANEYALVLMGITTFYVVKGGMFSVVVTEVIQFCILSVSSIVLGLIAMSRVSPEMLARAVPAGWYSPFFGWKLDLDWSGLIASVNAKIAEDGYSLFGYFFMMLLFKGILISAAGPAPNYDMQRVLSTKSPREASLMNAWVNVVLIFPRYFLITGLTILALVFYSDQLRAMGSHLEMILPYALGRFVPAGLLGLLVAGLLAAFMSNFAATVNAAPPYIVNDIYKRFINPDASPKTYVRMSYAASLGVVILGMGVGWKVESIDHVIKWIVAGLWGGYTASNVLKWYWWRFNGHGYFWGMVTGIGASLVLPFALPSLSALNSFPLILAISLVGCFAGTLLTPAEEEEVLLAFYKRVRPWGFWAPILQRARRDDPTLQPNRDFGRDMFNVVVGICWQSSLVLFPVCLVIRKFETAGIAFGVIAATSLILKLTWYDHLERREDALAAYAKAP